MALDFHLFIYHSLIDDLTVIYIISYLVRIPFQGGELVKIPVLFEIGMMFSPEPERRSLIEASNGLWVN